MTPDKRIHKTATKRGKKTLLRQRTVNDFADALDWALIPGEYDSVNGSSSVSGSHGFTGTKSADDYRDMLREGWTDGVEGVEGLDGLSTDASDKIEFVRNVGGAFPIVPAYLSGAPDAMLRPVPQAADSVRGLTLVIDASFNCGVNSDEVIDYARSVMRLLAWLQAEGIETAVYATISMQHRGQRLLYTCPIREAGDVMMPERIASICHPSFLRRAWFALVEREHAEFSLPYADLCNHCYGYPQTVTTHELSQAIPEAYSIILLPKVGSGDPDAAVREAYTLKIKTGDA